MGIGDWGLGIAIPNPQSPIPKLLNYFIFIHKLLNKDLFFKFIKL